MTGSITLVDVLDDAALLSLEHQIHLAELLGEHGWSVDLAQERFTITCSRRLPRRGCCGWCSRRWPR
jgi:hypothetical protein